MNFLKLTFFKTIIFSLILFSLFEIKAFSYDLDFPTPTSYKYINDYVGIIDDETKNKIVSIGKELEDKTGAQATIVIIDTIGDDVTLEDYSNKLFRTWGIGQKDKDNGLLILLALSDRIYRVEVGRGLDGSIPDLLSHDVMETFATPHFKNDDYASGLLSSYSNFSEIIAEDYNLTLEEAVYIDSPVPDEDLSLLDYILIPVFFLSPFLMVFLIIYFSRKSKKKSINNSSSENYDSSNYDTTSYDTSTYDYSSNDDSFGGGSSNGGGSSGSW